MQMRRKVFVLYGFGGIGKTQLIQRLPEIQISELSRKFSQGSAEDLQNIIKDVMQWLSRLGNKKWLLIFNNIDRDNISGKQKSETFNIKIYFPEIDHDSILIIIRFSRFTKIEHNLKIAKINKT
jgi:hypothetical protein